MWLLAVVLAALCIERAAADSLIPAEVSEAVPPEAAQLMADVGDAPEQSLWQGLRGLWTAAQDYVAQALHQRLSGAVVLLHSTSKTNAEILDALLTKWEELGYCFGSLDALYDG